MYAVEFEALTKDNYILIPDEYKELIGKKLKIIVLIEDANVISNQPNLRFNAINLKTKNFKFNREDANAR